MGGECLGVVGVQVRLVLWGAGAQSRATVELCREHVAGLSLVSNWQGSANERLKAH